MINAIVGLAVKFRTLVIGATLVLIGLGVVALQGAKVDEFADFTPPQVEIQAEALGLSAAEVEQLITVPLEQDLLNGVPWLDQITSKSLPGLSTIDLVFTRGTDLLKARQMVQEHLTQAHALPQVGTPPVMVQPTASDARVLMVSLGARHLSLVDLSVLARWKIKPRLEGLPGVANVSVWGQRDRQLQVQVDATKLRHYGVTLDQVISSTGNALWVSPLTFVEASTPGTGGFVDTASQRLGIQHITPITTARTLSQVTIEDTGRQIVKLGQVSDVVEGHQPLIGDAVLDHGAGLMLVIQKFPGADTRTVTAEVEDTLDEMRPGLAGVSIDTSVYRPASYIDTALGNLGVRALAALILCGIVLVGFAFSWRLAIVSLTAIVASVVGAAYVLYLRGTTFDVMTLAGLAAAAGIAISEGVIGAEVFRRPSQAHASALSDEEVIDRTRRIRGPLTYATLVVLLLPLPALALTGVTGSFARSLVVSYVLAVGAAYLVALVAVPALASLLYAGARGHEPAAPLARAGERLYARAVRPFTGSRAAATLSVAGLVLAALTVLPQLYSTTTNTLPALQDRNLMISWRAGAGTSLPEMARITGRAEQQLRTIPGVAQVGGHVGRALMADQPVDVDAAGTWIRLTDSAPYGRTVDAIRAVAHSYPGMGARVSTYPTARLDATRAQAPRRALVVRIYGPDLTQLAAKGAEIRSMLTHVSGVSGPAVERQHYEPAVQVQVDLLKAERYGLTPGDVRRASATYFAGLPVGSIYEDQKIFDVVVWGKASTRQSPADVANLLLDIPDGGHVRLGDVAHVDIRPQPTVIRHSDISRYLDVSADVHGRSVDSVIGEVQHRLSAVRMPEEFHAEVLSGTAPYQSEHWQLGLAIAAAVVAILLLLQLAFGSWLLAALTVLALPLGASGAVLVAPTVGGIGTLGAILGVLAVLAVCARDAVLALRRYQDAAPRHDERDVLAAAGRGVVPTALTALTMGAVLLPFAVGGVTAGTELLQPFAVVCLGGLVTSTFFTLFVLPALYLRMPGHLADRAIRAEGS